MRIAIIGAGASGIYTALSIKDEHPDWDVFVFDKENKIGKKLRATGNGRCNLLNANPLPNNLFGLNQLEVRPISQDELMQKIASWNVPLTQIDDLFYPASLSAPSYVEYLTKIANKKGVVFRLGTPIGDYRADGDTWRLYSLSGDEILHCNRIVFASGGKSSPHLGSDGSLFLVLKAHGYAVTPLESGLAPIVTKEKIAKDLVGARHACRMRVTSHGSLIYEESGEYLYKKDGLSGIAIFNASSAIAHAKMPDVIVHFDLFPDLDVAPYLEGDSQALLIGPIYEEVRRQAEARHMPIAEAVHDLLYHFDHAYDFADSQVTIGGIDFACLSPSLESRIEPGIYFVGECLNVDGFCGGFNLSWALYSAIIVAKSIH